MDRLSVQQLMEGPANNPAPFCVELWPRLYCLKEQYTKLLLKNPLTSLLSKCSSDVSIQLKIAHNSNVMITELQVFTFSSSEGLQFSIQLRCCPLLLWVFSSGC